MSAHRIVISRHLVRDVAVLALSLFVVTCSGDTTTQPPPGPTQLAFKISPGNSTAGVSFAPSVVVEAHDANGNLVSDYTGTIALTILTNPGGGTMSGTTSINAVGGVATFSTLSINKSGSGYKLQATSGNLTAAQSALFDITSATATKLDFSNVPASFQAGVSFALTVTAHDQFDNVATDFTGQVTLALNATGGAILSGNTIVTATGGVANFVNLSIDKIGNAFSFGATGGGLTGGTSTTFNVSPGPAAGLVITGQPSNTVAAATIAPAVTVAAHDNMGNVATAFTGNVCFAITNGTGAAGATLGGTACVNATAGVATFSTLTIAKAGTGYTLSATASGLAGATTAPFDIAAGAASVLVYLVAPGSSFAGSAIAPAVQVAAEDGHGNVVTSYTGNITLAIGTNPGGSTLSGTTTSAATAGIATFANLNLDKAAVGYTLAASASGLTGVTSGTFNILSGAGATLVFVTEPPASMAAGTALAPAVQVAVHDNLGNTATGFNGPITIAIGNNPSAGTLSGTVTVAAAAGVATFSDLRIDKIGVGYTLSASASVLSPATSTAFDIVAGAASKLVYVQQPSNTVSGVGIAPAITVKATDAGGNLVSSFTGQVTMTITSGTGTAGATLAGTNAVSAVAGVATFSGLNVDKAGTGYTLDAAAAGLSGVTSSTFNIAAGTATQLIFTSQPSNAQGTATITPAIQITALDAHQNIATGFGGNIAAAITSGTGTAGATLSGTTTVAAVAGVATFSNLSIDKAGTGYTLTASASGITSASSSAFDILVGGATKLVFSVQPTNVITNGTITPAVQVTAQDAGGNTAATFTGNVALTIGTNPSSGTLGGTTSVSAVAGVATFSNLTIDRSGTGYTLAAASAPLTGATSTAFDVAAGVATHLQFTVEPNTGPVGVAITPAVQVTALDALNNVATSFTGSIAIAIGTNPSGGALTGTTSIAAVAGVATFSTLKIDKLGTGYTLVASAGSLAGTTSAPFDMVAGVATKLVFSVQPSNLITHGTITPAVQVTAQDALGNTAVSFIGNVTLTIGTNPGGGTLSGTATVAAVAGVATFADLSIDKSGTGYTLTAAASGLTGATSTAFKVAAGAATHLQFTVQPSTGPGSVAITPAVQVTALDSLNNIATSFTGNIALAIGTNPSAGTLSGTTAVAAVAGVATFSTLKIDKLGTGYTLVASATGLTGATSAPFDVVAGAPTKLAIVVQPVTTTAGVPITPSIQVAAQDAAGNLVASFAGNISLAIKAGTGTSGASLRGSTTVGATAGVATFPTVNIDKAGTGYVLNANSTGLTTASTSAFNITVAPAVALMFTAQPATPQQAAKAMSPTIKVAAVDSLSNTVPTFASTITIAIGSNGGSPLPGTLTGTLTVSAAAGVASFSTLQIDKVGTGYTLAAAATGLLPAISTPFDVTPGSATQLQFTTPPVTTVSLTPIPPVKVTAFDGGGNVATGFTGNITVAIGTNPIAPHTPTLTGTLTIAAVAGVSTFSNLSIDSVANGYTLKASATGLTGATSPSFNITNGSTLNFTVQPTAVNAGAVITPAVQVTAKDNLGKVLTSFTGNVTVAIASGTGTSGATLGGTTTVAAVAGVATFSTLTINTSGTGYKLTASATGFLTATSNAFTVNSTVGAATKLAFIQQPSSTPGGSVIAPGPIVALEDAVGNIVKGVSGTVTVAIGTNPGGGTLAGTTTVNLNAGEAAFQNLSINNVGTGYTLAATTSLLGITDAASTPFDITAAATIHLAFTVEPSVTTAGKIITPAVQVSALSATNALVTSFTGPITVAILAGSGPKGATLGGTLTVNAVGGVATFADLAITKSGTGFKLQATSPGLAAGTSTSFVINPDVATTLHFAVQPTTGLHATTITPAVQVDARDQFNNIVKAFVGNVTVAIAAGTGTAGAVLSGTTTQTAVAGIATFSNLSINLVGTAYKLTAGATGFTTVTSSAFSEN